jgi:CheY-like chemotaxis protein
VAKILIADDHRANRDALSALLESAGHYVLTAPDGEQALKLALEHHPELVISDVLMPQMDGYELTRRLKLEPATAGMSVMFYTAYFGGQDAKQLAQALGVARVLVKPSDNEAIVRAVDEVLGARAPAAPADAAGDLDRDHLRLMVDQLLEKTTALEAQQKRVERLNRTLAMLSSINALIVRADDRQALLDEACRIAVEQGGFRLAAIGLGDRTRRLALAAPARLPSCAPASPTAARRKPPFSTAMRHASSSSACRSGARTISAFTAESIASVRFWRSMRCCCAASTLLF